MLYKLIPSLAHRESPIAQISRSRPQRTPHDDPVLSNVGQLGSGLNPETHGQHRSGEKITHLPACPREYLASRVACLNSLLCPLLAIPLSYVLSKEGQCQRGALPSERHLVLSPSHRGSCISLFGGVIAVPSSRPRRGLQHVQDVRNRHLETWSVGSRRRDEPSPKRRTGGRKRQTKRPAAPQPAAAATASALARRLGPASSSRREHVRCGMVGWWRRPSGLVGAINCWTRPRA